MSENVDRDSVASHCPSAPASDYDVPSWLLNVTHQIRYSPNCVKRFEVRLVGRGFIDGKPPSESRDRIGYGNTVGEAAEQALSQASIVRFAQVR